MRHSNTSICTPSQSTLGFWGATSLTLSSGTLCPECQLCLAAPALSWEYCGWSVGQEVGWQLKKDQDHFGRQADPLGFFTVILLVVLAGHTYNVVDQGGMRLLLLRASQPASHLQAASFASERASEADEPRPVLPLLLRCADAQLTYL
ncbi:uncharacterized protein PG986_010442 [Apiospora aurea]|uniref:Uncharacterized protein n=1 Tax=Apiospora aurea TaxID=335848 RepID=A0ABR1Q2P5_9PEZI